jgi:HSP20 family molecular chaperone IbpA
VSTAKIENGVLTITLPKMEMGKPAKKYKLNNFLEYNGYSCGV